MLGDFAKRTDLGFNVVELCATITISAVRTCTDDIEKLLRDVRPLAWNFAQWYEQSPVSVLQKYRAAAVGTIEHYRRLA